MRNTSDFRVTQIDKPIRILRNDGDFDPITIPDLFNRVVENYGENPALAYLEHGTKKWKFVSYKEYKEKVDKLAKVFIKLGLKRFGAVAVLAFNSVEWFMTEMAAIHAGGVITGIYTTNSVDSTKHVIEKSGATIVVVDDAKQMDKVKEIKKHMPHLKVVIQTREPFSESGDGYYTWDELFGMDTDEVEEEYRKRRADIAANDCCCLIFTSGTTGHPKGVMLSHDNILFVAKSGCNFEKMETTKESIVSYLPLSHIAAQIVDIYAILFTAGCTYFAERDALKGSLGKTLKDVRPTRFLGVPRVYEKMQEKMLEIGSRQNCLMRCIGSWAKRVTLQHHMDIMAGKPSNSFQYKIAKKFILSKVKQAMGFDRCLTFATGAAPMSTETKRYFLSLDIPIIEIFGMSECAGGHSFSVPDTHFETIGKGLPGCQTRIRNPDINGHGELMMRGRHIFMGYLQDIDKTYESILEDGWLASGDVAHVDHEGHIFITGRLKELIITAGGENIPPNYIEQLVKAELPAVSNAFLIGDRKKYLTILISLKTLMAPDTGMPMDELSDESIKWMEQLHLNYTTLSEVLDGPDPYVLKAIQEGIDRANKKAISNAQKIQKFRILPHDFSIATSEIGPTMKVKRNVVVDKYRDIIDSMYQ